MSCKSMICQNCGQVMEIDDCEQMITCPACGSRNLTEYINKDNKEIIDVIDENGNVIYSNRDDSAKSSQTNKQDIDSRETIDVTTSDSIPDMLTHKVFSSSCERAEKVMDEPDKLEKLLDKLEKKMKDVPRVGEAFSYLPKMGLLIRSYIKKEYTDPPAGTICAIIAAIIYFVSPIDLIPDIIPGIGHLDDAAVVALCLACCKKDIDNYMEWRESTKTGEGN